MNSLPLWSAIPFAGLLLSIAVWPLLSHHIWEHHYGKIAAAWSLPEPTAAMTPSCTAISIPVRPSGRFALRRIKSNMACLPVE